MNQQSRAWLMAFSLLLIVLPAVAIKEQKPKGFPSSRALTKMPTLARENFEKKHLSKMSREIDGAKGGILEVTDSESSMFGAKIEIPGGAFSGKEVFSIRLALPDRCSEISKGRTVYTPCVVLEPSHFGFKNPVRVTLPLDSESTLPDEFVSSDIWIYKFDNDKKSNPEILQARSLNQNDKRVTFNMLSFSTIFGGTPIFDLTVMSGGSEIAIVNPTTTVTPIPGDTVWQGAVTITSNPVSFTVKFPGSVANSLVTIDGESVMFTCPNIPPNNCVTTTKDLNLKVGLNEIDVFVRQSTIPDVKTTAKIFFVYDPGRIAFTSSRDGNADIWAMDPDGSNLANLTNQPSGSNFNPSWSPDGNKIAFHSNRDGAEWFDYDIWVMDANGDNQTNLTNTPGFEAGPGFSYDNPGFDGYADWSPVPINGEYKILFNSTRDEEYDGYFDMFVIDADPASTNPVQRITTRTWFADANFDGSWSPDGSQIVFSSTRDIGREIYVMNADGSGIPLQLTDNALTDHRPAWSPVKIDGKDKIAFESQGEIYIMNADGTGAPERLASDNGRGTFPSWSPDGTLIIFSRNFEIYMMDSNPATSDTPQNLTQDAEYDMTADWGIN